MSLGVLSRISTLFSQSKCADALSHELGAGAVKKEVVADSKLGGDFFIAIFPLYEHLLWLHDLSLFHAVRPPAHIWVTVDLQAEVAVERR